MLITVTEKAADKLRDFMQKEGKADYGLRVVVSPGGCSGMVYDMRFEKESTKDDEIIDAHGVKIYVSKYLEPYVKGVELDFVDSLQGSGFIFNNPNAKNNCGCGKSFGV